MIFTFIFTLFYIFLSGLIGLLPNSSPLPIAIDTSMRYVFGFLYAFDFLVSVQLILTVLGLSLAFEVILQIWHGIHWLIRKIPLLHIS